MTQAPTAYPLCWPPGWPRSAQVEKSKFQQTLAASLTSLKNEVRLLGGSDLLLSSNVTLDNANPRDCGVVAYFTYEKRQVAMPCDRWHNVEGNIRAIALTIESMRAMERWGAKHMIRAMFSGFIALPSSQIPDWTVTLGHPKTLAEAEQNYKRRMMTAHPDKGGSHHEAAILNAAIEEARRSMK